jgi:hypothetical protein
VLTRDAPGRQYVGLARSFLSRVEVDGKSALATHAATVADCRRLTNSRRKIVYRPEDMAAVTGQWRSIPAAVVLTPLIVKRGPKMLSLKQTQISTISASKEAWGDHEEVNLMIDKHEFSIIKNKMRYDSTPMFAVSQHALARWYQRTCGATDDAALHADLAGLVHHKISVIPAPPLEVQVAVRGGKWLGRLGAMSVLSGKQFSILEVRTFV